MNVAGRRRAAGIAAMLLAAAAAAALALLARRRGGEAAVPIDAAPPAVGTTRAVEPRPRRRAPTPAEPPTSSVHVAVSTADGKPIRGARVELVRGPTSAPRWEEWTDVDACDFRPSLESGAPERVVSTDAAGAAAMSDLPAGRWFVVAEAPGFGRRAAYGVSTDAQSPDVDAPLALVPGVAFGGTILDPSGAPAVGVPVVLAPNWNSSKWPSDASCLRTSTGPEGAYRFDSVAPGEYRLWYAPQSDLLLLADTVRVPAIDRYDVRLAAGAVVEGTIGDVDHGDPVSQARVLLVQDAESYVRETPLAVAAGRSDAGGRFSLRTWRPRCEADAILIDDPRFAPDPIEGGKLGSILRDRQRVNAAIRVRRGARLVGTAFGPDGPVAGLGVGVSPQDAFWLLPDPAALGRRSVLDAEGRFRFDRLPAGDVRLFVETWDGSVQEDVAVAAGVETTHDLRLDIRRVRVTGRVVDAAGSPISDVAVTQEEGSLRAATRTGDDGTFALDAHLPIGAREENIRLTREGLRPRRLGLAEDDKNAVQDAGDLTMSPALSAVGVVTDIEGKPVAGAEVHLLSGQAAQGAYILHWTGMAQTVSAADGTFRLPVGDDDCYGVVAFRAADGSRSEISGVPDDPKTVLELRLPATQRVGGRVVAAESGAAISDVLIHEIRYADDDVVIGRTGADGSFAVAFAPQPKGALRFTIDGRLDRRVSEADAGAGLVVVSMPVARSLSGVVRAADGTPAADMAVVVRPSASSGDDDKGETTTGPDGRFVVHDLAPGGYAVRVEGDAFEPAEMTAPAGGPDLEIVVRAKPR